MNRKDIRVLDKKTIRECIEKNLSYLNGDVLDFGSGDEPYRDMIENYTPFEPFKGHILPTKQFDAVLCTQVIQEVDDPRETIRQIWGLLKDGGNLVLTYNTNWEEYGYPDRWRFTKVGMEEMMKKCGFTVVHSNLRYSLTIEDWQLAIGYEIVCKK